MVCFLEGAFQQVSRSQDMIALLTHCLFSWWSRHWVIAWSRVTRQRRLRGKVSRHLWLNKLAYPLAVHPKNNIFKFQNGHSNARWSFACRISLLWQHSNAEDLGHVISHRKASYQEQGEALRVPYLGTLHRVEMPNHEMTRWQELKVIKRLRSIKTYKYDLI